MSGTLYLLPTPISSGSPHAALPPDVIKLAHRIEHFLVEDAKTARAFLKQLDHPKSVRDLTIIEIGHAPHDTDIAQWLAPLRDGVDIAVVSEAGCPAIADPGATLVAAAHRNGCKVQPLVGPSSIILALMASVLNGQRFRFVGYLPIAAAERAAAIHALEAESKGGETQIFIETPYRNTATRGRCRSDRRFRIGSAAHRQGMARSTCRLTPAAETTCCVLFARLDRWT